MNFHVLETQDGNVRALTIRCFVYVKLESSQHLTEIHSLEKFVSASVPSGG